VYRAGLRSNKCEDLGTLFFTNFDLTLFWSLHSQAAQHITLISKISV
jgi:hypothetical protein